MFGSSKSNSAFAEAVKNSFSRAKEHICALEEKIDKLDQDLAEIKAKIASINDLVLSQELSQSSIGNDGVQQTNNKQTTNKHSTNKQTFNIDSIKKDILNKFKSLTQQEMLVFLTLTNLEEESGCPIPYSAISNKLNLTEVSIRVYIGSLINKGIPIEKVKLNNKKVLLSVKKELREIELLDKLLQIQQFPNKQTTLENF